VDTPPADGATPSRKTSEMPGVATIAREDRGHRFRNILTGDESWFTLQYQHSAKWSVSREELPETARQQIGTENFWLTVIFGVEGLHVADLITS
jgi:hypothetical protein